MPDQRRSAFLKMIDDLHERHLVGAPGVREIWLVRHADAYTGMGGLGEGLLDPPLSSRGHDQAARLARRLSTVPLDAIWSSDLRRARETAEAVAAGRRLPVRLDTRLREVRTSWDEGRSEGLSDPGVYPFPEPEAQVAERMGAAVEGVVADLEDAAGVPPRAVVVSHNAAISVLVSSLLGLRWGALPILPQFTSVTVLAVRGEQIVVHSLADATHLAGA